MDVQLEVFLKGNYAGISHHLTPDKRRKMDDWMDGWKLLFIRIILKNINMQIFFMNSYL